MHRTQPAGTVHREAEKYLMPKLTSETDRLLPLRMFDLSLHLQ
jgi:hypothetical protein